MIRWSLSRKINQLLKFSFPPTLFLSPCMHFVQIKFKKSSFVFCQTVVREALLLVWTYLVSPSVFPHPRTVKNRFLIWWVGLELCFFFFNFGSVQDVSYCRPIRFEYFGEEMNIYQHGVDFSQLFVVIYGPPPVNRPVPPPDPNLDHFEKRI